MLNITNFLFFQKRTKLQNIFEPIKKNVKYFLWITILYFE